MLIELPRSRTTAPERSRCIAQGDDLEELLTVAALKSGVDPDRVRADGGNQEGDGNGTP
jgi:hypothetical protein